MISHPDQTLPPEAFYDALSDSYDEMTRFSERLKSECPVLQQWVARYAITSALDAGCGTGLQAICLAKQGVQVVGADISPRMLEVAKQHALQAGVQVQWTQSAFTHLSKKLAGPFDAIFCLGNSLPHLTRKSELKKALKEFYALLAPEGILVVQLLNYEKILKQKQRIVGIRRSGNREFIRFYDFQLNRLVFNILIIEWRNGQADYLLQSTRLKPYTLSALQPILQQAQFEVHEIFGDLKFSLYDPQTSSNLVLVCKKIL